MASPFLPRSASSGRASSTVPARALSRFLAATALLLLLPPQTAHGPGAAHARVVGPGESTGDILSNPLTGVTLDERPDLIGEIILDLAIPLEFQFDEDTVEVIGTARVQVVRESVAGTLDFYYAVENSFGIEAFTVSGFDNFFTDIDWRRDLGTGAQGVFRTEDGELLDFVFPSSGPTFVKTDATDFAVAGEMRVTFSFGPTISAEVPVPIPLPPALLAAPAGFALAILAAHQLRRRRVRT